MSDNCLKRVQDFCEDNGFNPPNIAIKAIDTEFMAVLTVITGEGIPLEMSRLANTEVGAKMAAIKAFTDEFVDRPSAHSVPTTDNRPLNDSQVSTTRIQSSDFINDDVADIPNTVGYLNEICQKKGYAFPSYEVVHQSGEPHNPTFEFLCTLDVKGFKIEAKGKGCPKGQAKKRSAQQAIRQLREYEAECAQNKSNGALKSDIGSYFKSDFHDVFPSAEAVFSSGSDYSQKLDQLAELLKCRLNYVLSADDCNHVVLQMVVKSSGYTLVTTDANSDRGVAASKAIAAKKAVLSLKILLAKYDN